MLNTLMNTMNAMGVFWEHTEK